jgi:hypothetical protein
MNEFNIPSLRADSEYAAAQDKHAELKTKLADAERERDAGPKANELSERDRRIKALATGEKFEPSLSSEQLTQRISDLHRAIELQSRAVVEAECNAGRRIAEQVKPQYEAIMKRGAKAVKALAEFLADEAAFGDALYANGIRACGVLPRIPFGKIDSDFCKAWLSQVSDAYGI